MSEIDMNMSVWNLSHCLFRSYHGSIDYEIVA